MQSESPSVPRICCDGGNLCIRAAEGATKKERNSSLRSGSDAGGTAGAPRSLGKPTGPGLAWGRHTCKWPFALDTDSPVLTPTAAEHRAGDMLWGGADGGSDS